MPKSIWFPDEDYEQLVTLARQAGFRVSRGRGSQLRLFVMAAANNCVQADGATWHWADERCPKCGHVHWAYGAEMKHCIVCQRACDYYGEASFITSAPPRR